MDKLNLYVAYDRQGRFLGICSAASDGMCIRENLYQICNSMRMPEQDVEFYKVGSLDVDIPLQAADAYEGDERLRFLDENKVFSVVAMSTPKLVPHSSYKFPESSTPQVDPNALQQAILDVQSKRSSGDVLSNKDF